jgi:hypothetical protein
VLVAGGGQGTKAAAEAAAKLAGVTKVLLAEGDAYAHDLAEPLAALIVALAPGYDAFVAPATSRFKNVMPRRRRPARRDAGVRDHQGGLAGYVRAADLCRQRDPDGEVQGRQEGHHGADLDLCRGR